MNQKNILETGNNYGMQHDGDKNSPSCSAVLSGSAAETLKEASKELFEAALQYAECHGDAQSKRLVMAVYNYSDAQKETPLLSVL